MSKKRKHDNVEEGDHQHPLYPQDQSGSSYYRFRDETAEEEGPSVTTTAGKKPTGREEDVMQGDFEGTSD